MDIRQCLAIFYQRLQAAPSAKTAADAFGLICRVLEEVENEFCPIALASSPPQSFDGRMYAPQADNIKVRDDGSMWVKTQRHRIAIQPDGSFVIYYAIEQRRLVEEFRKSGGKR